MTHPTLPQIATHHDTHGGLWLIIPARTETGQPRPLFGLLGIAQGALGPVATMEGGDLSATIASNNNLKGAEWLPVNSKGERV